MHTQIDWFDNDELFKKEMRTGHRYALLVGQRLKAAGLDAVVTEPTFRPTIEARHEYADEADITVGEHIVECKSRALLFEETSDSYPFTTAFVDTASGWNRKTHKPVAVVLVSQVTHGMLAVPAKTEAMWETQAAFDQKRGINDTWLACPRNLLRPMADLIGWLKTN